MSRSPHWESAPCGDKRLGRIGPPPEPTRTGRSSRAPGLVGYGGDTERVYLLLTENPDPPYRHAAFLATKVHSTGIGQAPKFSWRGTGSCWSSRRPASSQSWPAGSLAHLTMEAGRAVLAENYAAYVAEYGEDA
ncbi:hypothetical protein ACWCQM_28000 [Streptomyces sp. NPDC002125]